MLRLLSFSRMLLALPLFLAAEATAQVDLTPVDQAAAADHAAPEFELLPRLPAARGGLGASDVAQRAVAVSPRARRAAAEQAHAMRRAERASFLFAPRVDLSASYTRLSDVPEPPTFPGQPNFFRNILNRWDFRAALLVPVSEYFLTLSHRYDSAQHLETFGLLQAEAEQQVVAYEAQLDYYELARAIANEALSAHRVVQLGLFTEEIETLVRGGELGTVDLAQARTRLSGARAAEHRAQASRKVAQDALRLRLELTPDAPVGLADDLIETVPAPPPPLDALQRDALRDRPEARALQALILANKSTRDAIASARYPTLSVLGDVTLANPNQRYIPPQAEFNTTWSLGVQLAWSPTELSVQNQNLDDSELEVIRAREDLRALHDRIALEVATAYENAVAARGAVATSRAAVEAAEETYRVRNALFRGGEATSRQVLDAEVDLRVAQLQWIDDVLAIHMAHAALARALGQRSY